MLLGIPLRKFWGHVHRLDHELSLQSGDQSNLRTIIFEDVDLLSLIFGFNPTTMGCVPVLPTSVLSAGRGGKEIMG